jgi:hypothetical protein
MREDSSQAVLHEWSSEGMSGQNRLVLAKSERERRKVLSGAGSMR